MRSAIFSVFAVVPLLTLPISLAAQFSTNDQMKGQEGDLNNTKVGERCESVLADGDGFPSRPKAIGGNGGRASMARYYLADGDGFPSRPKAVGEEDRDSVSAA